MQLNFVQSYRLYSNLERPNQSGSVVTVSFTDGASGVATFTLEKDVTQLSEDEQVKAVQDAIYKGLYSGKYQNELLEKAQQQVETTQKAVSDFEKSVDTIKSDAIKAVRDEINQLVDQATAALTKRVSTVETETSVLKKIINANNLSKDQKKEIEEKYPNWQPSIQYSAGSVINYNGKQYEILSDHTSQATWLPDQTPSLYKELKSDKLADGTEVIKDWVQPTGAHDVYNTGDKVAFEGKVYRSLIDSNTFSPSAYPGGWEEVK